ncbi:ABC transporter substrate-binding protein [Streptomyces exfoliatus]|uniref:ABC transporter substrate-binding protein n=1 Tax=Streptomyces exfoliatus TaxID=1905 RepID=A0ABV3CXV9_STREX
MRGAKSAKWVSGAIVVALAATACGGGTDKEEGGKGAGKAGGEVSVGISEPKRLVPQTTTESEGSQVLDALFRPLVSYDAKNQPVEDAAESITSTDNTLWTVKIKPGQKFHDGTPVTAKSYVQGWNWGAYGPNAADGNYFFATIEGYDALNPADPDGEEGPKKAPEPTAKEMSGLKVVDDTTFTVKLAKPFADYKTVLGYTVFYPLPDAAIANIKAYEQAPIGQGAFKIEGKWDHNKSIKVVKNPDYTGDKKPLVDSVTYKIYQKQETMYKDVVAGALDVIPQVPSSELANAPKEFGERFKSSPASTFQFVSFPTYDKKYAKPEVRKAISMAIDREEITKVILNDSQSPARSFVSPVVGGYRDNTCGDSCKFDPAAAKALLAKAGGIEGNKINIGYNGDGGHKEWVDATCNQVKKNLGVDCVGQAVPQFAELLTQVEQKKFSGMFRMGWIMDYPSMENYLGPLFTTGGSSNYYGYSNKKFDKLVEDGRAAKSSEEAIKLWQQAEDVLVQDMPVIPLRFGKNVFAHSKKVANVEMDLFNRVDVTKISKA